MTQGLFVYGTLAPGQPNAHVLEPLRGEWQAAKVRGYLKQLGWGSDLGYPGIVLDSAADWVPGQLFVSEDLETHWPRLDAFEGSEYRRQQVLVSLANDEVISAFIYALREVT